MRVEVTKEFEINAAHFQPGYPGKCERMHGHNYVVQLTAVGDPDGLDAFGMLIDLGTMKADLEKVVGIMDHRVLNDFVDQPSIECMAMYWLSELREHGEGGTTYKKIRVYETPRSFCEVLTDDYYA